MGAIKKIGKTVAKVGDPLMFSKKGRGILFGKKGDPGGFLTPDLEEANLRLARQGFSTAEEVARQRDDQIRSFGGQLSRAQTRAANLLRSEPTTIKRATEFGRQRALAEQQRLRGDDAALAQGEQRQLQRGIARRGLGGSAAGLFASAQARRAGQERLRQISAMRSGLEDRFTQQRMQREYGEIDRALDQRRQLLGLQQSVMGQTSSPVIKTMRDPTAGTKGIFKGLAAAGGGIVGGVFGGPAGAKAGAGIGSAIGGGVSEAYRNSRFGRR